MVYVLLGTGFEEIEAVTPIDLLRRAGVAVTTVGLNGKIVKGSHKVGFEADMEISDLDVSDADMIVLPGGLGGVASISGCPAALAAVEAGVDMILKPAHLEQAAVSIMRAVEDGQISEARIDESVLRILTAKFALEIAK